jgi:biopolymer transport protein ExbD
MSFNIHHAQDESEPLLEINTTPLIDVMLVLLIMFIITIPAQLHAVNMQSSAAHGVSPEKPMAINIAIDADNSLWWNEQAVADKAALERKLQELKALPTTQYQQPEMRIQAHPRSKYGHVAFVLAAVQGHGFDKINIVE